MDDEKLNPLAELHKIYKAGNLRVLAGAGVSMDSGLPGWEGLNRSLLRRHLSRTLSIVAAEHVDPGSLADTFTNEVYERLGRDAVAELILKSSEKSEKEDEFHLNLAKALYQDRGLKDLYLSDLQSQIASLMMNPLSFSANHRPVWQRAGLHIASIYTTNFDPLLEMAMARTCVEHNLADIDPDPAVSFKNFRWPPGNADDPPPRKFPQVRHLHGWIDPGGEHSSDMVYAESHYIGLQRNRRAQVNIQTEKLFSDIGATVILGMSLTDPNLRRLLYWRSSNIFSDSAPPIYQFIRQEERWLASAYEAKFWKLLKVKLIPFSKFGEQPDLIRQIQWGAPNKAEPPKWFHTSAALSGIKLEQWYKFAPRLLKELHKQICHMYLTQAREAIRVTFWAPLSLANGAFEPRIYELGSVEHDSHFEAETADKLLENAKARSLDIRYDKVQGLAGVAFVAGALKEGMSGDGSSAVDHNFTPEMHQVFDRGSYRDWRSMLAVPILGGPFWLPLGVICVHSNFEQPFLETSSEKAGCFQ